MTPTTAVPPEVSEYLAAVRAALDDLPATERDDLLAEVEPSLLDAASETGGSAPVRVLKPTGAQFLPGYGDGLTVSPSAVQSAVHRLMDG